MGPRQHASWSLTTPIPFYSGLDSWCLGTLVSCPKSLNPTSMDNVSIFSSSLILKIDHTSSMTLHRPKGCPQCQRRRYEKSFGLRTGSFLCGHSGSLKHSTKIRVRRKGVVIFSHTTKFHHANTKSLRTLNLNLALQVIRQVSVLM